MIHIEICIQNAEYAEYAKILRANKHDVNIPTIPHVSYIATVISAQHALAKLSYQKGRSERLLSVFSAQ